MRTLKTADEPQHNTCHASKCRRIACGLYTSTLLQQNNHLAQVAVCAGLGSVAGYGYLQLLMRDVDTFRQDDPIAEAFLMAEDSRLEFAALRYEKRPVAFATGQQHAFEPQMACCKPQAHPVACFQCVTWHLHISCSLTKCLLTHQYLHIRSARKLVAAMRAALRPRLLVLVGLAAAAAAYNSAAPEPLNGVQTAALFTGFLTYKAGQLVRNVYV